MDERRLIVIGGATATGKSAAAVALCQSIGGEVVSCDSMQLYRGMDIGTAKPTKAEMGGVPHHMLSVLSPDEPCSASRYREMALPVLSGIALRGKIPVLCGGTGLYIDSLTRPMSFSHQSDPTLRAALKAEAALPGGPQALHARLSLADPVTAQKLHPNDVRRVTRALEVVLLTGVPASAYAEMDAQGQGDYDALLFALEWPRDVLYARIDARVDQMMATGLLDETRKLIASGVSREATSMQAIGYKELWDAALGNASIAQAADTIKTRTRHYAKRQLTWFRRDGRTIWIQAEGKSPADISREMEGYL